MAYTAEHLTTRANRRFADFDPGVDTAVIVDLDPSGSGEMLALTDGYRRFLAAFVRTVGTGALDTFEIIAATDADGTGATAVVSHAVGSEPDALMDTIWLECDIEQVRAALSNATHIGVRAEFATATDEGVIYFERADPLFAHADLTADVVA